MLEIWNHFKKIRNDKGEIRAKCNYHPAEYAANPIVNGTTNLKRHVPKCPGNPDNKKDKPKTVQTELNLQSTEKDREGSVAYWRFDQDADKLCV